MRACSLASAAACGSNCRRTSIWLNQPTRLQARACVARRRTPTIRADGSQDSSTLCIPVRSSARCKRARQSPRCAARAPATQFSDAPIAEFVIRDTQPLYQTLTRGNHYFGRAEGVGARMSATKSAMVKSVSCPMAEITGTEHAAIARATRSSLKVHRSSSDPPPRATITTSAHPDALNNRCPRPPVPPRPRLEPAPDRGGYAVRDNAAPARAACPESLRRWGSHQSDALRQSGQRALAASREQAFGFQFLLQLLEGQLQCAVALRFDGLHHQLQVAAASYRSTR